MTSASSRRPARALNCDGSYGVALVAGLAVLLLPLLGGDALERLWRYTRSGLAGGEWWRLVTAHIVHLDLRHGIANAAGFALLWALFARSYRPWRWCCALVLIIVAVDAGLWFLSPRVQWYVGVSALLHGAFACGTVAMIRSGERLGWLAAIVFVVKLVWEQWQGPLPLTNGPVVTASHVYGAAGGLLAALLLRPQREPLY